MIGLDTNVILRLIVGDDLHQTERAHDFVENNACFVPITTTLECEWVLRSFYKYAPDRIAAAIEALTDVGRIVFEHVDGVRWALDRLVAGADFADMIHIVQTRAADIAAFATFDGGIATKVGHAPPLPVQTLA